MNELSNILGLDFQELTELAQRFGQKPYRAQQLFDGLYAQRAASLDAITTISKELRAAISAEGLYLHQPDVQKKFVSQDGTVRYLIGLSDGQSVETVWMPEGDFGEAGDGSEAGEEEIAPVGKKPYSRATICVSSQVGCAVNCHFCLTALLGLKRNLTAGEIVGQILVVLNDHAVEIHKERINIVFMGQGEPFHNYDNFIKAVRLLVAGVKVPEARMTVSTSGVVSRIYDMGKEPVRPKLAISLNASNDKTREAIMPITRKWKIADIIEAARQYPLRSREVITFEYVMLGGVNDSLENALELIAILRSAAGLRAKVNLIAWNPGPEVPYATPTDANVRAFQRVLIDAGIATFVRRPRGRDIYAACGQLKRTEELASVDQRPASLLNTEHHL